MKKFIYILIIFVIFIANFEVYAARLPVDVIIKDDSGGGNEVLMPSHSLSNIDYNIECIYSDGSLLSYEWSIGKNDFIHNRLTYNLSGASNTETNAGGNIFFSNQLVQNSSDQNTVLSCPAVIYTTTFNSTLFYKFRSPFSCGEDTCPELQQGDSNWCKFWGCDSKDFQAAKSAAGAARSATLYSERFILKNTAAEPTATLYYMMPAEQASGVNTYIKIMVYNNVVLLEKDGRVTNLDNGKDIFGSVTTTKVQDSNGKPLKYINNNIKNDMKTIYLNSPEPNPVTTSSSSIAYSFNKDQIRYSVSKTERDVHTNEYVYAGEGGDPEGSRDDSLCTERLKNTSPILKWIIQAMLIAVPAFVIILTGIDIGKLVIAGNLEEELPKRKKIIRNRIIIMVAFFFLPLLSMIILELIKDSADSNAVVSVIADISCLFKF